MSLLSIPRVHFDFGAVNALSGELARLGIKRPLFTTDPGVVQCGVFDKVLEAIGGTTGIPVFDQMPVNPTVEGIEKAFGCYVQEGCDGVVAVGGGSVIDASKILALRAFQPGPISRYDRRPERIKSATSPLIAVPTTAGTGSEVTMGAGIHPDPETPSMHIGSPFLQAKVAICDPGLTMTLPPEITAGTGMDALNQCIEGFLSVLVNPPIDAIALDGLRRAYTHIERAVADGSDREARWEMLMAALEGGISIGKTLGPGHAIANTFGDRGFHHGILVTVAMPSVLRFLEKYAEDKLKIMAKTMGLKGSDTVADAVERLNARIGLPRNLRDMGYVPEDPERMAEICEHSPFNRNSPHRPTKDEYMAILTMALA